MTDKNPIIEKIKKLLRMKRGGTSDEIATALRLAQELADKHGIDLNQVNPDDETILKPITHADEVLGKRVSWESKYAVLICKQFFKVSAFQTVNDVRSKYVYRFVGEEWDIQIATFVYRFLCGHFRREWKTRRGRCRNRLSFLYGMYLGICSKLQDRQPVAPAQAGLIRLEKSLVRRNEYIKERWGDLNSKSVKPENESSAALDRGWRAGRETEIRQGVTNAAVKQLTL